MCYGLDQLPHYGITRAGTRRFKPSASRERSGSPADLCRRERDQAWLDYQEEIGLRHTPAKKNKTEEAHTPDVVHQAWAKSVLLTLTLWMRPYEGTLCQARLGLWAPAAVLAILFVCGRPAVLTSGSVVVIGALDGGASVIACSRYRIPAITSRI
jgi:hypothetical protein